jgi:hypothetical protein
MNRKSLLFLKHSKRSEVPKKILKIPAPTSGYLDLFKHIFPPKICLNTLFWTFNKSSQITELRMCVPHPAEVVHM